VDDTKEFNLINNFNKENIKGFHLLIQFNAAKLSILNFTKTHLSIGQAENMKNLNKLRPRRWMKKEQDHAVCEIMFIMHMPPGHAFKAIALLLD
jgi:hypothetical protein